mmetsp:Transcript_26939/g.81282  ORF Transcript_26939/g.81282 Transcript_26939/m.81282 type:complete len:203 (+) Transcript_26939:1813-2421(+)
MRQLHQFVLGDGARRHRVEPRVREQRAGPEGGRPLLAHALARRGRVRLRGSEPLGCRRRLEGAARRRRRARGRRLHEPLPVYAPLRLGRRRELRRARMAGRSAHHDDEVLAQGADHGAGHALGLHPRRLRRAAPGRLVHLPRALRRGAQRERHLVRHRAPRGRDPARQAVGQVANRPLRGHGHTACDFRGGAAGMDHAGGPG